MNPTSRSILAIAAGFLAAFILSVITDIILEKTGMMIREPFSENSSAVILFIVVYRTLYNTIGCYIAGKLAPAKPMRHAMILGYIGLTFALAGTIVMWHIPPHWYPISLVILTLPGAWLGGKLAEKKIASSAQPIQNS